MPAPVKKKKGTKSVRSSPALGAMAEYERQARKYEKELAEWHFNRVRLLLVIIGAIDLLVGAGVALLAAGLVQLSGTEHPVGEQPLLLSGLIMTIVFVFVSLICCAAMFVWKKDAPGLPGVVGFITFIGLFGGLAFVNTVLCAYAWFRMGSSFR